jgi:hypothetical protein
VTSKRTLLSSALLALALAGTTTACGGSDDDKSSGSKASHGSSSSASASAGAKGGDGGAKGGSGGEVDFKVVKNVPSDFPKSDVPMIGGTVLNATQGAFTPDGQQVKGWTVRLKSGKPATKALADAQSQLTAAGFKDDKSASLAGDERALKSDAYDVRVRAGKLKKSGSVVIYTVIPS